MKAPSSFEQLVSACRSRGLRLTGQRLAICEAISRTGHQSADQIHAAMIESHPRVSIATVYRTLRLLSEAGVIEEHRFGEGRSQFEIGGRPHHDHLIDAENGAIIEFCDPEIERLQEAIADRLGYRLTGHRLELFGVRAARRD